ncbi:PTS system, lactose-specific, repressor [Streptococcus infantarius subsp. infantarius]|nr:DeoR/GlpR family DNA-binding transcription regulator [Streptococcus infantarius]MCO4517843.1 PTS system, lactose-specific, repressor [Streptococcus infantarius subsp. infantarius]MCO4523148.1 PTS system, lactose-specific, repressor [Streptococcus infantarius subsp. infantarius]MCO4640167.1 PTS system, lactose-specific, repressor [Streptococcus infantarius subsp. infantarius]MCO4645630.1 PTS system, lactose-specific, repressor [Streptococcus infantarius subsp. infantarius]MCO4646849.1 PTS sy
MEKLSHDKFVRLDDLVSLLDTSESTVRRDLDELESERKLHRVHGGAELPHSLQEEFTNQQKSIKNIQEKMQVARKAASLVSNDDVIFVDAGTTNELLLGYLNQDNLTVVTNSIHHAAKLVDKNIQTIIIGGHVKKTTDASIGAVAYEQIKQLNFDKAFLGINGIDEEFLTTPDMEEAVIKKNVIENARKSYIVTDSSKIGRVSFAKVDKIENATIITNQSSGALMKKIKENTRVIEV